MLFNVFKYLANVISYWDSDFLESTMNNIISDYYIAAKDCWKMSCFNWEVDYYCCKGLFLFNRAISIPGVSIIVTNPFNMVNYLLSLVIPYYLSTIAILSPIRQLKRLLFPQLGNPIKDTLYLDVGYLIVVHYFYLFFLFEL